MKNKKWIYLIVFGLVLNIAVGVVSGNVFFQDTDVYLHCDDNEVYKVDTSQPFSHVVVDGSYVQFNNTAFRCDFDEDVNVTLLFLNELYPYGNLTILSFTYEQGNGVSLHDFNLSGFISSSSYQVYTNNTLLTEVVSSGVEGWVNFTSNILFGRIDIVWYPLILFSQLDGEGAGRGETGGDYLYDEVPLNNSYRWFNKYGFTTGLSIDYTVFNFSVPRRYEYNWGTWSFSTFGYYLSSTFTVGNVSTNESFILTNITINATITLDETKFHFYVCNVNVSGFPTYDFISEGFVVVPEVGSGGNRDADVECFMSAVVLEKGNSYGLIVRSEQYFAPSMPGLKGSINEYLGGDYYTASSWGDDWVDEGFDGDLWFRIWGKNITPLVNLTFDWYNDSLGDWQLYAYVPVAMNMTYNFHNYNFSGIDTYIWRVTAVASDTGVTHQESYQFTTFVLSDQISRASMGVMLACTLFIIPFWLMWKRRRKKDEKKTY